MASVDATRMRWRAWVAVGFCAMAAGCLEIEQTVELHADGSGTQQVRLELRETTLKELEQLSAAARMGGAGGDPQVLFDKERVSAELQTGGLELLEHAVTKVDGRRTVTMRAAFPNFAALQASPLSGSSAEWVLAAGPTPGTCRLTLYPQGKKAWIEAREKAKAMAGETDAMVVEFFRKRQAQLQGLDVTFRLKVPGDVSLWTANMEKTGDREVTARVTADDIKTPQDLVRRLAPRFEVVFDATGTSIVP